MSNLLAVLLGKTLRGLIRMVRSGGGSALPGLIVSKIWPDFLAKALSSIPDGIVIVTGSAGKSSTTHTISSLLGAHGKSVFTNESTANIRQGLISAVLQTCNFKGQLPFDIAVLEVDEGHLTEILRLGPRVAVMTNILSDQLDRFVDPAYVLERLATVATSVDCVVINGDDPNLNQMNFNSAPIAVGLSGALLRSKTAPRYAFNFGKPTDFHRSIVVFGKDKFELRLGKNRVDTGATSPQHALNDALALAAAQQIMNIDLQAASEVFSDSKRVFARNEIVEVSGKKVNLRLVQNPTSFQLNLDELEGVERPLMLMAGSDIHDPSWLWTVDFSKLKFVDLVAGSNAYDLALRLYFAGVKIGSVETDPTVATDEFLSLPGARHTILFSADAMRRTRRHLGLAK